MTPNLRLANHLRHAAKSRLYADANLIHWADQLQTHAVEEVIAHLPLTTKEQLAAAGPNAYVLGNSGVAEWVCTSGTAGRPLDVPLTPRDLDRLAQNEATALYMTGIRPGDLVILAVGMDRMFVAGLAYWLGAQKIGATCIRTGPQVVGNKGVVEDIIRRCGSNGRCFLIAVPSFLTEGDTVAGICGVIAIGEPVKDISNRDMYNSLGRRVWERFGCPVMSTYASTEICTTFAEGPACFGGHLNEELGVVECLDKEGVPVGEGEVGEIVVTPLGVEGLPLVRFRTGDMAVVYRGVCGCGLGTARVGPIVGRRGQLLKMRGVSVFPNTIIDAVRGMAGVVDCVVVAEEAHALSDVVVVHVAVGEGGGVRGEIERGLRGLLRVLPEVRYVGVEEVRRLQAEAGGRKGGRFVDRRGRR